MDVFLNHEKEESFINLNLKQNPIKFREIIIVGYSVKNFENNFGK